MNPKLPPLRGVYAITPCRLAQQPAELFNAVEAALAGGIALLQYRDKLSPPAQRRRLAEGLLLRCRAAGVPLIINDDLALAVALRADGVHLGLADASLVLARQQLGEQAIIGMTCGNQLARAQAAEAGGASYIAFGAVYRSSTKPNAPQAPLSLFSEARQVLVLPLCAIGGITAANAPAVAQAGADLLAVIEGVFAAPNITAAVQGLRAAMQYAG